MIWWIENPTRSASERLAVENLAGSQLWLQIVQFRLDGTRVCWDLDIVTPRRSYPITLRYPDFFPGSPPLIFPRGVKERWSFHQYGAGGELCLEIGPDNWDETYTGVDMLESAYRLLTGEEEHASGGLDVDSRHKESLGQLMRTRKNRIFIPAAAHSFMAELLDFKSAVSKCKVLINNKLITENCELCKFMCKFFRFFSSVWAVCFSTSKS